MGSIPIGYILTKIFIKKDIREIGSGNIGTTNALRTGNKFIGYSTLTLDILKAVIPVIFIKLNYAEYIYLQGRNILADQMDFLLGYISKSSPIHHRIDLEKDNKDCLI